MRAAALDERDIGQAPLAEPIAEMGDKLEARGSAADNDNSVPMGVVGRRSHDNRSPALRGRPEARPIAFQARQLPGAMGSTRASEPQWIEVGIRWRCRTECDKKMFLDSANLSTFGLDASVPFAPPVHPEREGEADAGRARDDRSRKADNDRKGLRRQSPDFRSLRWRRSRRGPDEPAARAAQPRSRSRASLVRETRRAGRT